MSRDASPARDAALGARSAKPGRLASSARMKGTFGLVPTCSADDARRRGRYVLENDERVDVLIAPSVPTLEGSARNRAKALQLIDGRLDVTDQVRVPLLAQSGEARKFSADTRVGEPASLVVELKARSIHGSQDAIGSDTILKDQERVGGRTVDLFVLVADRELYDRLRGLGRDSRGRKARAPDLFASVMPASESLSPDFGSDRARSGPWRSLRGARIPVASTRDRTGDHGLLARSYPGGG